MADSTVSGLDSRWKLFDTAPALVEVRIDEVRAIAQSALNTCLEALDNLSHIGLSLEKINTAVNLVPQLWTDVGNLPDRDEPTIDLDDFIMDIGDPPPDTTDLKTVTMGTFPNFGEPSITPITAPDEENYTDALLTAIKAKMLDDLLSGNVGMPAAIEDAIFNRESERALLEHQNNLDRISAQWGAGGWPVPNGALRAATDKAETEYTNKRLDVSRDVAIKNFELTLTNMHFIIQYGIQLETHLMDWAHNVAVLALDASKAVQLGDIETFKTLTDAKKAKLQGIIEKAQAEIAYNKGQIDIYLGKMQGYSSKAKAEADRVTAVSRGYETQASVFQTLTNLDISKVGLDFRLLEMKMKEAEINVNVNLKDKEIEARNQEVISTLAVEVQKAIGSIGAQLVAGALSAVHAQVSMGASNSASYSASLAEAMAADEDFSSTPLGG